MDTAFSMSSTVPARAADRHAAHGLALVAQRLGVRLVAWSRNAERRHTREHLADRHERRLVAEQLRDERFQAVALARLM